MELKINFDINNKLFLKNPDSSDLGKEIVKKAIDIIYEYGFENFTLKKVAKEVQSTEATLYRYFENKNMLLLYILNWYWSYLEFMMVMRLQNITDPGDKLRIILEILTQDFEDATARSGYDKNKLHHIVMTEGHKAYMIKDVDTINQLEAFDPYKSLSEKISGHIKAYNPEYPYPLSLSTTLIEAAHHQVFFSEHLPRLSDAKNMDLGSKTFTKEFLKNLVCSAIGINSPQPLHREEVLVM